LNGLYYSDKIEMGVRGALVSNGLFVRDRHNYWHVKEPDASTYIITEIEKLNKMKDEDRITNEWFNPYYIPVGLSKDKNQNHVWKQW